MKPVRNKIEIEKEKGEVKEIMERRDIDWKLKQPQPIVSGENTSTPAGKEEKHLINN